MKTWKRSKMTVKRKRFLPVLLTLFLLAGCGQQAPPSEYTVGAESLPALAVSENGEFSEETDPETEETSYTYSGLASGEKAAASYVSQLEEAGCSVINEEGEIQKDAGVSEEDGAVLLGRESEAGDGVVSLRITWDADSCTVTPFFQEELQLHEPQEEPEGGRELSMTQVTHLYLFQGKDGFHYEYYLRLPPLWKKGVRGGRGEEGRAGHCAPDGMRLYSGLLFLQADGAEAFLPGFREGHEPGRLLIVPLGRKPAGYAGFLPGTKERGEAL